MLSMPAFYPPDLKSASPTHVDPDRQRPHAGPIASPFLEFDLKTEIDRLHAEPSWSTGRNARTLAKYETFRVVLTALRAGVRIAEHRTDGRISIHVVHGHLRLTAAGRVFDLRSGGLVSLDHSEPHDLEAIEDSAFLLTMAWPGRPDQTHTQM
jgi:quercetin dioxygenase-like cupin family protein